MLAEIKTLIFGPQVKDDQASGSYGQIASVSAALLIEMAVMDGQYDADERAAIIRLLTTHFEIDEDDLTALIADAEAAVEDAVDLFSFTRGVCDSYEHSERCKIIEMMWEVAYADGTLHDFEANLVRRVSGLLNVSDRESGESRKRVLDRIEIDTSVAKNFS